MTLPLQWTQDLSVGVDEIDKQHKELFNRINNLFDAIRHGKGREDVGTLINFLEDYTVMHFALEERYMANYDYPDSMFHKSKHSKFIQEFSVIKNTFESNGATVDLVIRINIFLTEWWMNHIRTSDKLLGVYLKKRL